MTYPFNNPELPIQERVRDLISRLTIEEKAGFIPTRNFAVDRLGVPEFWFGAEGAHGFVDREGNNTTFPQTIGLAATWDKKLLGKIGRIAAIEARCFFNGCTSGERSGIHRMPGKGGLAIWSPTIDLERDPRWGRTEEGYGEDPHLTSELSCEYIKGAQGDDPKYLRATCAPKHFFANNNEADRASCSCSIPPRLLHEYYLVPFKNAYKKANAMSMMAAYNEVNGIPMMMHPMLNDIVKNEWGLQGNIVTDGGDFMQTVTMHHYFETHTETLAASLKAGMDSMTDNPEQIIAATKEALEKGLIDEAELDRHLERIISVRIRLGLFDPPGHSPYDSIGKDDFMKDEYIEVSREAVRKSAVLLKNEDAVLPLKPDFVKGSIAVMGPLADELHLDWYAGRPVKSVTPLEGLKETYGDKIAYTDCRDIVSFTTDDGRPMVLIDVKDNEGNVKKTLAAGKQGEKPAQFYMEDWGWGVKTFTDEESGLMLEGCYARREPPENPNTALTAARLQAPPPYDDSAVSITATAKNNLSWFGFTLFNIVPQENGLVLIKTHDNRRVTAQETGKPVKQHDDPLPAKGELFRMKIERDGIAAAAKAAADAQQVIFFAGNDPMINGRECIDRPSLNLPPRQEELIKAIAKSNPRTILYILSGYPYTCGDIAKQIPAIVWMAHGIQETGHGIADIISGAYSPAGRLPMTWYEDESRLPPSIMEYDIMQAGTTYQYFAGSALWPFGHGLSYSSFSYSDLFIDKKAAGKDETVNASFKVKNTGSVTAEEVPQMYVTVSGSVYARAIKTLKGFDRISLAAGEEKTINFELPISELAVWDSFNARFAIETGYCTVAIGASSEDIRLTGGFGINGETLLPRNFITGKTGGIYAERFDNYSGLYLHEKRGSSIPAVFNKEDGAWLHFASLNFETGISKIGAVVQGSYNGIIEIRLDSPDGLLAGTIEVPNTGDVSFYPLPGTSPRRLPSWGYAEICVEKITGIHDVFLIFYGKVGLWKIVFND